MRLNSFRLTILQLNAEIVFQTELDIEFFVYSNFKALKIPGTNDDDVSSDSDTSTHTKRSRISKRPLTEYEKKRKDIEDCKKSLPVYPFREQLLDAIAEHQVRKFLLKVNFVN